MVEFFDQMLTLCDVTDRFFEGCLKYSRIRKKCLSRLGSIYLLYVNLFINNIKHNKNLIMNY